MWFPFVNAVCRALLHDMVTGAVSSDGKLVGKWIRFGLGARYVGRR